MIRRDALREYSRGSLWLLPTGSVVLALVLGALLSRVNVGAESLLAFQGTADDARALLIGITGTMVTVIALLLGLAVVALQLSTTQFSPRLLRNFLRDRPNQIVGSAGTVEGGRRGDRDRSGMLAGEWPAACNPSPSRRWRRGLRSAKTASGPVVRCGWGTCGRAA